MLVNKGCIPVRGIYILPSEKSVKDSNKKKKTPREGLPITSDESAVVFGEF